MIQKTQEVCHEISLSGGHGCVRIFYEDAQWLNREFVEKGTPVLVKEYET